MTRGLIVHCGSGEDEDWNGCSGGRMGVVSVRTRLGSSQKDQQSHGNLFHLTCSVPGESARDDEQLVRHIHMGGKVWHKV